MGLRNDGRYVYVIESSKGPIKIGISWDPRDRLSKLKKPAVGDLKLLGQWFHPKAAKVEKAAHRLLNEVRIRDDPNFWSEWFRVSHIEAYDAVMQAMVQISAFDCKLAKPIPKIQPFATQEEFRLGYARSVQGVPAAMQAQWLKGSGVNQADIFFEEADAATRCREAVMKEVYSGDSLLVWAPSVLGTPKEVEDIQSQLTARGVQLLFGRSVANSRSAN